MSERTQLGFTLPPPSEDAQQHSLKLLREIKQTIKAAGGCLGFDRYMDLALYAPGLGYYQTGLSKIGQVGDFITAPEISPLFSQCVAYQCAQVLMQTDGDVLEFGAGSGALAAGILATLQERNTMPKHYFILELSNKLQRRQRHTLQARVPELMHKIIWLDRLPQDPFSGVMLANEVLDAMPVQCFALHQGQVSECCVACDEHGSLCWQEKENADLAQRVLIRVPQDCKHKPAYSSEINLRAEAWVRTLGECLRRGVLLIIDYGYPRSEYYHSQRVHGTLLCHYQHRAHNDVFFYPGLQDISANVEFTAIAEAGLEAGLALAGYTSQANFLFNCGLDQIYQRQLNDINSDRQRLELSRQIKLLSLPSEMGERFQVMALSRASDLPLMGFSHNDWRHRL